MLDPALRAKDPNAEVELMGTLATPLANEASHPVRVHVDPALDERNRLTTAFRLILAIPHLILVGGPIAAELSWTWGAENGRLYAWVAILFTGRYPEGLWSLAAYYLRWRVRAVAYTALLRDEYPPFGDGNYPAWLDLAPPTTPRDRVTVGFRLILAIPHLLAVWLLGIAWGFTSVIAWFAILFTGSYPAGLNRFGVGVLRWNTRVEAYLLLLRDEYPPFSLE